MWQFSGQGEDVGEGRAGIEEIFDDDDDDDDDDHNDTQDRLERMNTRQKAGTPLVY